MVIVSMLLYDVCDRWSGGHTCIWEHYLLFIFFALNESIVRLVFTTLDLIKPKHWDSQKFK